MQSLRDEQAYPKALRQAKQIMNPNDGKAQLFLKFLNDRRALLETKFDENRIHAHNRTLIKADLAELRLIRKEFMRIFDFPERE